MTVLVDEARWQWQGAWWAHLVSDVSYDELHEFASGLGKRRLGFQGDHYDVDEADRARAVAAGAVEVTSRQLVRRLRAAGLRNGRDKPAWRRMGEWPVGVEVTGLDADLARPLEPLALDLHAAAVAAFADDRQRAVLVDLPPDAVLVDGSRPSPGVVVSGARVNGWFSVELFVPR